MFDGCIVYVNGLTHPSAAELRDAVGTRGGLVEVHFETNVTHVVAENLPDGKIRDIMCGPFYAKTMQTSSLFIHRLCWADLTTPIHAGKRNGSDAMWQSCVPHGWSTARLQHGCCRRATTR